MSRCFFLLVVLALASVPAAAADKSDLAALLGRKIIGPRLSEIEAIDYLDARVPRMFEPRSVESWEKESARWRALMLERVVFRGEAANWRKAPARVEWLEEIKGGPGYRIKTLRYEALPGMWIPALLYEPEKLTGKVPVILNVNGHDGAGKAAPYKQVRCINLAKRGMLALNVEWLGMGQLRGENYAHARMNQLDLCGTSGLAPFYLNMSRGLDLLLTHPNADSTRVAVTGLSGGGWQTIFFSSLDERVTLANPVAGYSSFRTRLRHFKDLGDSEQTPCDMATVADYTHLTALRAPRPTLLTYNSKDNCCFESGYSMQPLLDAAGPVFKMYGKESALRSHVNSDPGTHNYLQDNREAFYRMIGDSFFPGDTSFDGKEIPSDSEVKKPEELMVSLPPGNADFRSLATALMKDLPRTTTPPSDAAAAEKWRQEQRARLREVVKAKDYAVTPTQMDSEDVSGVRVTRWKLRMGDAWTVPVIELVRGEAKGTTLLVADGGRRAAANHAERLLAAGQRVLAIDPFYFGESKFPSKDWLFALFVSAVGDRPLGLQASQVAAAARWAAQEHQGEPVSLVAVGPRSSLFTLVAAGLESKAIGRTELHGSMGSLKEVIEKNKAVNQEPELFCFGLLEAFDVPQLVALAAPRQVVLAPAAP